MAPSDSTIQAVVFDLDDTLYPERDYVLSGYRAVAGHLRATLASEARYEDWLWQRFQAGQAAGALDAMNEHFRLGLSPEGILQLVQVYRGHVPDIRPYPDVPPMLQELRKRHRLGLLTDGYLPAQRLKLAALGLEGLFDAAVFTEDIGRQAWKPSTAGFERIRQQLDVPHAACAYVADNPAKDFVAPNRLGWLSVQLLRPGQIHVERPAPPGGQPQAVARSTRQLQLLLGG